MDAVGGNRTFEDFDPAVEWSRAAKADAVKISLPGFERGEIRVLADNQGHLRTRGERQITGTRWSRFQMDFKLPDNCNVDSIRAMFDNEKLAITLQKKRPVAANRGLLMNVAVAVVVLVGITVHVWHTLRNATGGACDHGHGGMSYGDEM